MLSAMIMAGGGGTRFWPRSRAARPKQFLTFQGERTLLQEAFDRLAPRIPPERIWVLTAAAHRDEAAHQLPEVPNSQIVGEPIGRDTAACVALGAALIQRQDANATVVVTPADHLIEPARLFQNTLLAAEQYLTEYPQALLTFGIPPTFPSTGYGYIHRGEALGRRQGIDGFRVQRFEEKPPAERAERFLQSGEYDWNSGIFVWRAETVLAEFRRHKPAIAERVARIADAWQRPEQSEVFTREYDSIEKISVDFAILEHAAEVLTLRAPYQWDDVGSWLALERRNPQDAAGNTIQGLHVGFDTQGCVIASDAQHLIATLGVRDLLIIQSGNATLVARRDDEAAVKKIVDALKSQRLEDYL